MIYFLVSVLLVLCQNVSSQRYKTIYQKIQQEPQYNGFNALVRNNRVAKLNLHYEELTVFVPENKAFLMYGGDFHADLAFYHMSFEIKTLIMLNSTNSMTSVILENPPLWITRTDGDIYVNNAKIIKHMSNYMARSRNGNMGKQQVLHVIDEVLNPVILSPKFSPNAYDLLSSFPKWNLGAAKSVSNFFTKVTESKLQYVYKNAEHGHTFFIPLDSGIDSHKFNMINKHIIFGHVIPNYVLFTKPTQKNFAYESLANDNYVYIVLSFEERDETLFVKGLARGNLGDNNGDGEFYSEIIVANIPVKNGVIHLISQPLGIFNRTLKPFPYLPIMEKISNDPNVDVFYSMGERTGFNKIFRTQNISFTYFIPEDNSWAKAKSQGLKPMEKELDILGRHLVMTQSPYSIEQLHSLTKANNYTYVELNTQSGPLRIMVLNIEGDYYIKWYNRFIKVVRANYECTNGMIHILAGPLVNFRMWDSDEDEEVTTEPSYENYWKTLKKAFRRVV